MTESPFGIRGVIEGFYGTYFTSPERDDLIRFLGENGFNFYMYGPKNDRQHRRRWWEPYPPAVLARFADTIRVAQEAGVTFCYAISFGVPMNYSSPRDFVAVTSKLRLFYDRGCRSFALLVDDISEALLHEEDRRRYPGAAHAHADCANRLLEWSRSLGDPCSILLCPTDYHGTPPYSRYVHDLGQILHAGIDVFFTGPDVCPRTIAVDDVSSFAAVVGRRPLIWDNYPVNDMTMGAGMHVAPLTGRDPGLGDACIGLASNVMNQAEASKIALLTVAEYLRAPAEYEPDVAWKRAMLALVGPESFEPLLRFAENSMRSPLNRDEAPQMDRLVTAVLASLRSGDRVLENAAVDNLLRYLAVIDESCYHLKNRMQNLSLRRDLLPWIEALECRLWLGRRAISVLQALETGIALRDRLRELSRCQTEVTAQGKRIGGNQLLELGRFATERAAGTPAPGIGNTVDSGSVPEPAT